MNKNVMGKILKSNMKTAIALKHALGRPNVTENVARSFVANRASQKMKRRRNITNLVTLYRRGTSQANENANAHRRMTNRIMSLWRIPNTNRNEALYSYYRSTHSKLPLTNRNVGIIFSQVTPAALKAFVRSRRPQNTTLGRKLYVV